MIGTTSGELYNHVANPRPVLVVISGPSGVGKDATLQLMKENRYPFYFVVTATTRPRRASEVDGVDYHFVSVGDFAEMIELGELLEYAVVYGDYKGIPKKHVREALASGKDVIMRIDVQGAATIRRLVPNAVTIFLTAESGAPPLREIAARLQITEGAVKVAIHRLRQRYRELLRAEISQTVAATEDVDDELAVLLAALRGK